MNRTRQLLCALRRAHARRGGALPPVVARRVLDLAQPSLPLLYQLLVRKRAVEALECTARLRARQLLRSALPGVQVSSSPYDRLPRLCRRLPRLAKRLLAARCPRPFGPPAHWRGGRPGQSMPRSDRDLHWNHVPDSFQFMWSGWAQPFRNDRVRGLNKWVGGWITLGAVHDWDLRRVDEMSDTQLCLPHRLTRVRLHAWNTRNVRCLDGLLYNRRASSLELYTWNVRRVHGANHLFDGSTFNRPLWTWDTRSLSEAYNMFRSSTFNQPLWTWNTAHLVAASHMFLDARAFAQALWPWDVRALRAAVRMVAAPSFWRAGEADKLYAWDCRSPDVVDPHFPCNPWCPLRPAPPARHFPFDGDLELDFDGVRSTGLSSKSCDERWRVKQARIAREERARAVQSTWLAGRRAAWADARQRPLPPDWVRASNEPRLIVDYVWLTEEARAAFRNSDFRDR